MANLFQKATKKQSKLRMAIYGASGSGKTYSALSIARSFGKVAVIDTERGSASKYADLFEFDVLELTEYHPQQYINAIQAASAAGYDVVVIDSLSHAWSGAGGVLEMVDKAAKKSQSNNSYTAWRDVTPLHNQLVEALLSARCHLIATMRSKTEYVLEQNDRGKTVPKKVGLAPVQRDGMEYEFDVVAEMNMDNEFIVTKTRCPKLTGKIIKEPGEDVGKLLTDWLSDGAPVLERIEVGKNDSPAEAATRAIPPTITVESVNVSKTDRNGRLFTFEANGVRVTTFTRDALRGVLPDNEIDMIAEPGIHKITPVRLTYTPDGKFLKLEKAELVA